MTIDINIRRYLKAALLAVALPLFASCGDDEPKPAPNPTPNPEPTPVPTEVYALGADVSWVTKLESEGSKYFDKSGKTTDAMTLLVDECNVNAFRLRVWVNPSDGWNGRDDVLAKARRAKALGAELMVDFHFSDTWADPGSQTPPAAWKEYDIEQMKSAVSAHVKDILGALKKDGIAPAWVQIGNETTQGMLWPLGHSDNPAGFAALVNAGYDAVKQIFPQAKVIVHLDRGEDMWRYDHIFEILKANGGKYDIIGMSLYPDASNWRTMADNMMDNIATLYKRYGKPVMLCEIGMHYKSGAICSQLIKYILDKQNENQFCGVFYWEPEAPAGYNGGYDKGCFDNGRPTAALNAFADRRKN